MTERRFKLAAAQYPIDWLEGWQAYVAKLTRWVEEAAREGAQLLVFPEYGAMELASLGGAVRTHGRPEGDEAAKPARLGGGINHPAAQVVLISASMASW